MIVLVHGAGGGDGYGGLEQGLRDGGVDRPIVMFHWGAPACLFMLNLQDRGIHAAAEKKLAAQMEQWRAAHPAGRMSLIAHSAGCGVALGALGRSGNEVKVDTLILLAPSVSPAYDLSPAVCHISGQLHVFHSDRDTLWLKWRTGTFGTYDNVRTTAAGNVGFTPESLPAELRGKVVQHAYDLQWQEWGNDGGHFGGLAKEFAARVLAPLWNRARDAAHADARLGRAGTKSMRTRLPSAAPILLSMASECPR